MGSRFSAPLHRTLLATSLAGLTLSLGHAAHADEVHAPLSFEKYTLDNGLEVILHPDHRTPTVAVNVWYHVGSKDEPAGKNGFAHLFEHVMFRRRRGPRGQGLRRLEGEGFEGSRVRHASGSEGGRAPSHSRRSSRRSAVQRGARDGRAPALEQGP